LGTSEVFKSCKPSSKTLHLRRKVKLL